MISFLTIFIISFILGFSSRNKNLRSLFLFLLFILPWGGDVAILINIASIHPLIGFLYGRFALLLLSERRKNIFILKPNFLLLIIVLIAYCVMFNSNMSILARELLHIPNWLVLILLLKNEKNDWQIKSKNFLILLFCYLIKFIFFKLILDGNFNIEPQQYYYQEKLYYSDLSLLILMFFSTQNEKISVRTFQILILIPFVIFSGSITFYALYGISVIFCFHKKIRTFSVLLIGFLLLISLTIFDIDQLYNFIYYYFSRNYPFIEYATKVSVLNQFFGIGLGTGIEIPWFDKSETELGNLSIFYDNLFGTLYIKFGIIGLLTLFIMLRKIQLKSKELFFYIIISGLTNSVVFQSAFMILIYFSMPRKFNKDLNLNHKKIKTSR